MYFFDLHALGQVRPVPNEVAACRIFCLQKTTPTPLRGGTRQGCAKPSPKQVSFVAVVGAMTISLKQQRGLLTAGHTAWISRAPTGADIKGLDPPNVEH
jgi:hypothetical protein